MVLEEGRIYDGAFLSHSLPHFSCNVFLSLANEVSVLPSNVYHLHTRYHTISILPISMAKTGGIIAWKHGYIVSVTEVLTFLAHKTFTVSITTM